MESEGTSSGDAVSAEGKQKAKGKKGAAKGEVLQYKVLRCKLCPSMFLTLQARNAHIVEAHKDLLLSLESKLNQSSGTENTDKKRDSLSPNTKLHLSSETEKDDFEQSTGFQIEIERDEYDENMSFDEDENDDEQNESQEIEEVVNENAASLQIEGNREVTENSPESCEIEKGNEEDVMHQIEEIRDDAMHQTEENRDDALPETERKSESDALQQAEGNSEHDAKTQTKEKQNKGKSPLPCDKCLAGSPQPHTCGNWLVLMSHGSDVTACSLDVKQQLKLKLLTRHKVVSSPQEGTTQDDTSGSDFQTKDDESSEPFACNTAELTETSEGSHLCAQCFQSLDTEEALLEHEKGHTQEKGHKCEQCPASFSQLQDLENHQKIHSGDKPYACQYCEARYKDDLDLQAHLNTHPTCNECSAHFFSGIELLEHLKAHFSCEKCNLGFPSEEKLQSHRREHNKEKAYQCLDCLEGFSSYDEWQDHRLLHQGQSRRYLRCHLCPSFFLNWVEFSEHLQMHRMGTVDTSCIITSVVTPQSRQGVELAESQTKQLAESETKQLAESQTKQPLAESQIKQPESQTKTAEPPAKRPSKRTSKSDARAERRKKCAQFVARKDAYETDRKFRLWWTVNKGILSNVDSDSDTESCEDDSSDSELENFRGKRFSCIHCPLQFFTMETLTYHEQRDHENKDSPVYCTHCFEVLNTRDELETHEKEHEETKEFSCSECGAKFTQEENLVSHKVIHGEEKSHRCDQCPRAFKVKNDLESHLMTHDLTPLPGMKVVETQEIAEPVPMEAENESAPTETQNEKSVPSKTKNDLPKIAPGISYSGFMCDQCWLTFDTKNEFWDHLKIHDITTRFDCDVCSASFIEQEHLQKHRVLHKVAKSNKTKFVQSCDQCPFITASPAELETHKLTHGLGADAMSSQTSEEEKSNQSVPRKRSRSSTVTSETTEDGTPQLKRERPGSSEKLEENSVREETLLTKLDALVQKHYDKALTGSSPPPLPVRHQSSVPLQAGQLLQNLAHSQTATSTGVSSQGHPSAQTRNVITVGTAQLNPTDPVKLVIVGTPDPATQHAAPDTALQLTAHSALNQKRRVQSQNKRQIRNEKGYACTMCDFRVNTNAVVDFAIHLELTHFTYPCGFCPSTFRLLCDLNMHRQILHSIMEPETFACDIEGCDQEFSELWKWRKHRLSHENNCHASCRHCPARFRDHQGLRTVKLMAHEALHDRLSGVNNPTCDYICDHCLMSYEGIGQLMEHRHVVCNVSTGFLNCKECPEDCKDPQQGSSTNESQSADSQPVSVEPTEVVVHTKEAGRLSQFMCAVCSHLLDSWSLLVKHVENHCLVFRCLSCDGRFKTENLLRNHWAASGHNIRLAYITPMYNHKYACLYCFMEYSNYPALAMHKKNFCELEYMCSFCLASFSDVHALKKHVSVHPKKWSQLISTYEKDLTRCPSCSLYLMAWAVEDHLKGFCTARKTICQDTLSQVPAVVLHMPAKRKGRQPRKQTLIPRDGPRPIMPRPDSSLASENQENAGVKKSESCIEISSDSDSEDSQDRLSAQMLTIAGDAMGIKVTPLDPNSASQFHNQKDGEGSGAMSQSVLGDEVSMDLQEKTQAWNSADPSSINLINEYMSKQKFIRSEPSAVDGTEELCPVTPGPIQKLVLKGGRLVRIYITPSAHDSQTEADSSASGIAVNVRRSEEAGSVGGGAFVESPLWSSQSVAVQGYGAAASAMPVLTTCSASTSLQSADNASTAVAALASSASSARAMPKLTPRPAPPISHSTHTTEPALLPKPSGSGEVLQEQSLNTEPVASSDFTTKFPVVVLNRADIPSLTAEGTVSVSELESLKAAIKNEPLDQSLEHLTTVSNSEGNSAASETARDNRTAPADSCTCCPEERCETSVTVKQEPISPESHTGASSWAFSLQQASDVKQEPESTVLDTTSGGSVYTGESLQHTSVDENSSSGSSHVDQRVAKLLSGKGMPTITPLPESDKMTKVYKLPTGQIQSTSVTNPVTTLLKGAAVTSNSSDEEETKIPARLQNDNRYKCTLCPASFYFLAEWRNHTKMHTGGTAPTYTPRVRQSYRCGKCPFAFENFSKWKAHIITHTGEKPFKCEHCPVRFTQRSTLNRHLKIHYGNRAYKCEKCNASFDRLILLTRHQVVHRNRKFFRCKDCERSFEKHRELSLHNKEVHGKDDDSVLLYIDSLPDESDQSQDSKLDASLSDADMGLDWAKGYTQASHTVSSTHSDAASDSHTLETFASGSGLASSGRSEVRPVSLVPAPIPPFEGGKDSASSVQSERTSVDNALKVKTEPEIENPMKETAVSTSKDCIDEEKPDPEPWPYVCEMCPSRFTSKCVRNRHRIVHVQNKTHKCQQCTASYDRPDGLTKHMHVHTAWYKERYEEMILNPMRQAVSKPFSCSHCPARFSSTSCMKRHENVHRRNSKYRCDFCTASFDTEIGVRRHRLLHLGTRPERRRDRSVSQPPKDDSTAVGTEHFTLQTANSGGVVQGNDEESLGGVVGGEIPLSRGQNASLRTWHLATEADGETPAIIIKMEPGDDLSDFLTTESHSGGTLLEPGNISNTDASQLKIQSVSSLSESPVLSDSVISEVPKSGGKESFQILRAMLSQPALTSVPSTSSETQNESQVYSSEVYSHMRKYHCDICPAVFYRKAVLTRHRASHKNVATPTCPHCGGKFFSKYALDRHRVAHHGDKPYTCDECPAKFTRFCSLQRHKKIHTGIKEYKCQLCPRSFYDADGLRNHSRSHKNKRYRCFMCHSWFRSLQDLRLHKLSHSDSERPWKCTFCPMAYKKRNVLEQHMRTHTGERPYKCKLCAAKFTRSEYLRRHVRTHTGDRPYQCSHCDASFACNSGLHSHMKHHSNEHPYVCEHCHLAFKYSNAFRTHQCV